MMKLLIVIISYIQEHFITTVVQATNAPLYFYIFTIKEDLKFLKWSLVSCVLFGIGYWGVNAWSGIIFSVFSLLYLGVSYFYRKNGVDKQTKYITVLIVWLIIIILNLYFESQSLFIHKNFLPILGIVPTLIHAYIYICSSVNLKKSRWLFVFSHILLIIYEVIIVLPLFALVDICGLFSNVIELKKSYSSSNFDEFVDEKLEDEQF